MRKIILFLSLILVVGISIASNVSACDFMNGEPEGDTSPSLAYDPQNNRYLMVYQKCITSRTDIYGKLLKHDGSAYGNEFLISGDADPDNPYSQYGAKAAYDSVNDRFMVIWTDDRNDIGSTYDIYGQIVNDDGTLSGSNFVISNASDEQKGASVAYDDENQRFLVVWGDYRSGSEYDVYGQFINANGTLNGSNFIISDAAGDQSWPSLAYDSINHRFLATWDDDRVAYTDIYGQLINSDGTLSGSNFAISDASSIQWGNSLTYDNINHRFLVSWTDWRNPCTGDPMAPCFNTDIYGQLVGPDGTLFGAASNVNFVVSSGTGEFFLQTPSAVFNPSDQQFLAAWSGDEVGGIFGQMTDADGSLIGDILPLADDQTGVQYSPSVAYNSVCNNFLVALYTELFSEASISLATVGSCQASPPTAPVLGSPADGATGLDTTVVFTWDPSADADGDAVTYNISYCTDENFTGCDPVHVASLGTSRALYAAIANFSGFSLIGMFLIGGIKNKRNFTLLLAACLTVSMALISCSGRGGSSSSSAASSGNQPSHTVSGLNSGTTYYWKVTADDGKGGTTDSATRSFSTR